jgi:hypothetical protein
MRQLQWIHITWLLDQERNVTTNPLLSDKVMPQRHPRHEKGVRKQQENHNSTLISLRVHITVLSWRSDKRKTPWVVIFIPGWFPRFLSVTSSQYFSYFLMKFLLWHTGNGYYYYGWWWYVDAWIPFVTLWLRDKESILEVDIEVRKTHSFSLSRQQRLWQSLLLWSRSEDIILFCIKCSVSCPRLLRDRDDKENYLV